MCPLSLHGKVGLFGGTFNPLHEAHLLVARVALTQCALSEVLFVPAGIPPHKEVEDGIHKEDRYEMVRRAIADTPGLGVSRIEIDRDGPSYTIDTIRSLRIAYPEGLAFIVGAELLLQIETWKEPKALLGSVPFIVAPRDGIPREAFARAPFDRAELHFLGMEEVDLSSTWVRERLRRGEAVDAWVPRPVVDYIAERRLYRQGELAQARGTGGRG